jgi:hypothetical protein
MNINPAARSGLLFMGFFFGFAAIIALGAKASSLYFNPNGGKAPYFSASTAAKPSYFSRTNTAAAPRRF